MYTEDANDPVLVEGDCPCRKIQRAGGLLHRSAFREQLQNLALTKGQLFRIRVSFVPVEEVVDGFLCKLRRDIQTTSNGFSYGDEKFCRGRRLQQITRCSTPKRL